MRNARCLQALWSLKGVRTEREIQGRLMQNPYLLRVPPMIEGVRMERTFKSQEASRGLKNLRTDGKSKGVSCRIHTEPSIMAVASGWSVTG